MKKSKNEKTSYISYKAILFLVREVLQFYFWEQSLNIVERVYKQYLITSILIV